MCKTCRRFSNASVFFLWRLQGHRTEAGQSASPLVHEMLTLPKPWAAVPFGASASPWVAPGGQALPALPNPSPLGSVPGGTQRLPTLLGRREAQGRPGEGGPRQGCRQHQAESSHRLEARRISNSSHTISPSRLCPVQSGYDLGVH